ncbi:hypothetical protein LMG3412_06474 [Achromobacter deleyi]|nr:hypothetical protein LMG3412_06474 [Achromobacter deleyi]
MEAQAFGHQAEADHQQQAQAQDHHRRVARHEAHQRAAGQHHHRHGQHHRDHHDAQVFDHAHGGNHRVQREHRIQHHDLQNHLPEHGVLHLLAIVVARASFDALMQLHRALEQQEQAAQDQDQVAPRDLGAQHRKERCGQRHHPRDTGQQAQAHHHRQRQADHAGAVALRRGQLVGQNGNEHQVVDTQHDFKNDQRRQAKPGGRVGHPVEDHQRSTKIRKECAHRRARARAVARGGLKQDRSGASARVGRAGGARPPMRGVGATEMTGARPSVSWETGLAWPDAGKRQEDGAGRRAVWGALLGGSSVIDGEIVGACRASAGRVFRRALVLSGT